MGKALYRKYRSKSFDEVVGQEHITDTLRNALSKGQISHAYLFTGPKGVGKTSIARILAHAINDLPYEEEATHLDIIEIDAASNRRIDEIRELRDKVHVAPANAKYKVYIIDEVHMLTREAFNALLKTLEEPPAHAVFILATTEIHKVPETIISRTQRFTFKPISEQATIEHLRAIAKQEGVTIDDEALQLLAAHGRGSFRDSISMLDQLTGVVETEITRSDAEMLLGVPDTTSVDRLVAAVAEADTDKLFEAVRTLKERGIDSGKAAQALSEVLRTDLIEHKNRIGQHETVKLLKNLLPITLSSNDFIGLELAVLDTFPENNSSKAKSTSVSSSKNDEKSDDYSSTVSISNHKDSEIKQIHKEISHPTNEPTAHENKETHNIDESIENEMVATKTNFDTTIWNELLDDLKKKHNTLYGVLRMATPSALEDKGILLEFTFDFHRKQAELGKNASILNEYLEKFFGEKTYVCKTVPAEKKKKTVEKPVDKVVDAGNIETIARMFGGAELLES